MDKMDQQIFFAADLYLKFSFSTEKMSSFCRPHQWTSPICELRSLNSSGIKLTEPLQKNKTEACLSLESVFEETI